MREVGLPDSNDPYDLQRFLDAQAAVYRRVCGELRSGRKQSHWMWFIFPQLAGLGASPMARRYGIASLAEAEAYRNRSAREIFGAPDDMKFRSCLTLFARAAPEEAVFREALAKYFDGVADPLTLERL